jgi:predicted nucleic acid-binding protein
MKINNAALPAYPAQRDSAHLIAVQATAHIPNGSRERESAYIAVAASASVGLTKREEFAKAAMQGLCANHGTYGVNNGPGDVAARAVQVADALLAELAKEPQP